MVVFYVCISLVVVQVGWQLRFVWGCGSLGAEYLGELDDCAARVCMLATPVAGLAKLER